MISKLLGIKRAFQRWNRRADDLPDGDLVAYWRRRARTFGARSVVNLAHRADELDALTERQAQILFPLLRQELRGGGARALDFGCGPGRFTDRLAQCTGGRTVGVDVAPELLTLAPRSARTDYIQIAPGPLPFRAGTFDVVWSCLVLGGIPDAGLVSMVAELGRVLRPGGLMFAVENTNDAPSCAHWFFRGESQYLELLSFCAPRVVANYSDVGERISIFAGHKAADDAR